MKQVILCVVLFMASTITEVHGLKCSKSLKTVKFVKECPTNGTAWQKAAQRKRCHMVKQKCVSEEKFLYHCLINEYRNATVEVCAPSRNIVGKACAEFNMQGMTVQESEAVCDKEDKARMDNTCPFSYNSTDAYKYSCCYDLTKRCNNELCITAYNYTMLNPKKCTHSSQKCCPESRRTMEKVKYCPQNLKEWKAASKRKGCDKIIQTCVSKEDFVYHCVLNERMDGLIEVCAPKRNIVGHSCAEFNYYGAVIQENFEASCKRLPAEKRTDTCPFSYNSTDAYKYPCCYLLAKECSRDQETSRFSKIITKCLKPTTPFITTNKNSVSTTCLWILGLFAAVSVIFCIIMFARKKRLLERSRGI